VNENRLTTDLIDVQISPKTGGIQGIYGLGPRGNRLSQQVAFRLPGEKAKVGDVWRDPDLEPPYTTMVCDALEPTLVGPLVGELTTRGRLVDSSDRVLAKFTQRVQAAMGVPLLTVEIELEVDETPRADPFGSYYAARFAFAEEGTTFARSVFLTHQATTLKRPEAPDYLELSAEQHRTLILPDGRPYFVQTVARMIDALLIARGEERRKFRFGIVLDSAHPAQDALAFRTSLAAVAEAARPVSGEVGRLFVVYAKNVVATHWESILDGERVAGFRVRLLETEGRAGRVELHAPRKMLSARQVDFRGRTLVDVPAGDDRIALDIAAYEWIEVEAKY
jgi:alpha-mannosidase